MKDVCSKIGDLTKIEVHRYHPNSLPKADFLESFRDGSGNALMDAASLKAASPCMEDVRTMCSSKLMGTQYGFYSYREPTEKRADGQYYWSLSPEDGKTITDGYSKYVTDVTAAGGTPVTRAKYYTLGREALKHMDTCMASALQYRYGMQDLNYQGKGTASSVSSDHWQNTALLYNDCRPIEAWKKDLIEAAKCSVDISVSYNEYTSPVSLLWSPDVKIREVASRSKFPLNPSEAGKWFVWRGSGLTPLVVWDPEKSGSITGAQQLFGTHTWGKEWKHGYEPLATLDKDKNGWLEGDELKDIALWFDFNQDGISNKGEIKQLGSVGVTALGVKVTVTDEENGEVHAAKGFRRIVNGVAIEGASVDWFSASEDGRFGMEVLDESPLLVAKSIQEGVTSSVFDPLDVVSGVWDWRVVDQKSGELPENLPHGTFVLYSTNKEVGGTVYVAEQFAPNASGIAERVSHRPISGVTEAGDKGQARVTFSSRNQAGGVIESVAQLSEDGMYLAGITTEPQGQGKESLKYAWVARRSPLQK